MQEPSQPANERRYTVYRAYDAQNVLLYVGMTESLEQRFRLHRRQSQWWSCVTRLICDFYETYGEAFNSERQQILDLNPVHNQLRPQPHEVPPEAPPRAPKPRRRLLTTSEGARAIGVAASTLRHWIMRHELKPTDETLGGHHRWDVDDLRRQVEALKQQQQSDFSEE